MQRSGAVNRRAGTVASRTAASYLVRLMIRTRVLAFQALVLAAALPAVAVDTPALEDGRLALTEATDALFDESLQPPALRQLLERSSRAFARIEDAPVRLYWQAEVEYLLGFVAQAEKRSGQSLKHFEACRDLAQQSLAGRPSSGAYRLLADAYAQLLMLNGLLYKMSYGPKVREMAQEALRLDPADAKARLTLALYYKNAPAIGGGSRAKSLEILHQLEGEQTLERVDRFSVNAWLAISYSDGRKSAEARRYLERALRIYPGNKWLAEMLAGRGS